MENEQLDLASLVKECFVVKDHQLLEKDMLLKDKDKQLSWEGQATDREMWTTCWERQATHCHHCSKRRRVGWPTKTTKWNSSSIFETPSWRCWEDCRKGHQFAQWVWKKVSHVHCEWILEVHWRERWYMAKWTILFTYWGIQVNTYHFSVPKVWELAATPLCPARSDRLRQVCQVWYWRTTRRYGNQHALCCKTQNIKSNKGISAPWNNMQSTFFVEQST